MKKIYFNVTNNSDLNLTVSNLETVKEIIENDFHGVSEEDAEEFEYIIKPKVMTEQEFEELPEAE